MPLCSTKHYTGAALFKKPYTGAALSTNKNLNTLTLFPTDDDAGITPRAFSQAESNRNPRIGRRIAHQHNEPL